MEFLATAIKELQKSEKYSDLVLRCQGETFKVHCAVVCTRSPVFAAAVDGEFMEATTREIDLSADELPIVQAMIDYLCTGDYNDLSGIIPQSNGSVTIPSPSLPVDDEPVDDGWGSFVPTKKSKKGESKAVSSSSSSQGPYNADSLTFNVKMYVMGDKYDIPGLKTTARRKYEAAVIWCWNTEAFSTSADFLWENTTETDRKLRTVVMQAAKDNIGNLMGRPEFVKFMKGHGDFAVDVVRLFI